MERKNKEWELLRLCLDPPLIIRCHPDKLSRKKQETGKRGTGDLIAKTRTGLARHSLKAEGAGFSPCLTRRRRVSVVDAQAANMNQAGK
jgi:hypothetical protein